jgi:hypothetical protein
VAVHFLCCVCARSAAHLPSAAGAVFLVSSSPGLLFLNTRICEAVSQWEGKQETVGQEGHRCRCHRNLGACCGA